ncbi:MAG: hypothetical protein WAU01_06935 [Saprospiraceae bacterium]
MKWYHLGALLIYGSAILYFGYQTYLQLYVYFANKSLGHEESFSLAGKHLALTIFLIAMSAGGWYLMKYTSMTKLGNVILFFPFIVIGLFALWAIILVLSSGGKWN